MEQRTKMDEESIGFLAFLKSESERQRINGHIGLANNYNSAINSFTRFLQTRNMKDVSFSFLTSVLIEDYESYLQAGGLCKNTTSFYIRALHAVYYKAVRWGVTTDKQPFRSVYRGVAKTVKRAIEPQDICQLKALNIPVELRKKGLRGKRYQLMVNNLEFARDIFLFCFCARGLTFVDLAYMQKSNLNGGMLVYVRRKTKQRIEVQLEPMMKEVLDKYPSETSYLLPILTKIDTKEAVFQQYKYALANYNAHLKMLGEMLDGLKLTSYVSRHSWASAAHQQNIPLSVISQSMGHESEKTTEIYLKSLKSNIIHQSNHDLLANVFRS
ncbi:MAG: site-specific integrase [Bacteroidales bacterium]|nr:site-specific integrase [Bacteroidales bacterium]